MVWNKHLNNMKNLVILLNEFKINKVDWCAYVKNTNKCYVLLYLFMDDMLVLGNDNYIIKSTKKILTNKFNMKDLGDVDVILEVNFTKTFDRLILS